MALCKRNKIWWIRFSHQGKRIQQSAGTTNKIAAQELHDRLKADLWRQSKLGEKPERTWQEAVVKWLDEVKDKRKRSMESAMIQLRWLDSRLRNKKLSEINRVLLDEIAEKREKDKVAPATVNKK